MLLAQPSELSAQRRVRVIDEAVPADKDEMRADYGFPIDPVRAPRIIEAVLKHLKPELPADEWKDIIVNLQTLLDERSDKLVVWTDPHTKKSKMQSIRLVVNTLIGQFSKEGLDFYQREMGPAADRLLKEALERGDSVLLSEVSQRYYHTKAGGEATMQLARRNLDRGKYDSAAKEFDRFMKRNQQQPASVDANFLAALACKRMAILAAARGDKNAKERNQLLADEYWEKVRKEVGVRKITLGGAKQVTLAQLEAEYSRPIAFKENRAQLDWYRERGNAQNNAEGVGSRPFLDPTWQFSLMPILDASERETKGAGMAWIEQHLKQYLQMIDMRPNHPPIPAFFPIATSGRVMFRTYDGVFCLPTRDDPTQTPPVKAFDLDTGGWRYECDNSLYNMASTGGRRNQLEGWNSVYTQQGPFGIFFENGLNGSLSHDGLNVYFVDDMALPPHPSMQVAYGNNGMPLSYGHDFDGMVHCNKLVAVNLETGKLFWKAGGRRKIENKEMVPGAPPRDPNLKPGVPAPGAPGPNNVPALPGQAAPAEDEVETSQSLLTDAYFLGAPLPLNGKLYVVIEKDRELRLVCLDPNKTVNRYPELVWSQPLGTPSVPLPADTLRRIQGISLAYANDLLVVPTNAGGVLGIDLLSHNIVWACPYRSSQPAASQDANMNMMQLQMRGGGRIIQQGPSQQINADRWRISAPIISGDKVVFTAYDSNSIMCLNLRDGEIVWESPRGGDDLYVAGVIDNKVLVAGKTTMKFLDLNSKGTGVQLGIVNTATPSGVGTSSNGIYFLPVRPSRDNPEPEILSIDVKEMKIVAHTRSRKKIPTGNLVFFDGAVFSQTAHNLTSFPQLDVKIRDAERRRAANPNDPIGLAEIGDLKLDDGKRLEAIEAFNKCLANNPNADTKAKAREKLYDAITELLQLDFNSGEKMLDQYKDLCTVEILETDDSLKRQIKADEELHRKANYFCLVANGRESQGRLLEAFDYYLDFGSLTGNKELVSVIDQPNTFARPDVWALGRINHMMSKATPEQRKPLEARAAKEWETVKKSGNLEKLRNFVQMFGTSFGSGSEARLMLAEKLVATNNDEDLREAENILLGLKGRDDPAFAARATLSLAELYIRKGLFDDAMGLYAELNRNYPKAIVRAGQTGADVFNELITDKRFLPYIEPPRQSWSANRLKAQDVTGFSGTPQQQSFTISPEGESIPFYSRFKIVIDMMQNNASWSFRVIDRVTNEERFKSPPMPAPQYIWNYPQSNNHRFAQIRGHLLVLNFNHMVYAYDLADRKKLWEYNLFGKTPMAMQQQPVRTENEADGVRLYYQDGWTQKVGQIGVIESTYVCLITRDGLVAVDPAKGTVLWTKSNVSSRVQLMGDDNTVFVFESNQEGAVTTARAIRAGDGVEVKIPDSSKVFSNLKKSKTVGRRVLVLDEKGGKKSMCLYDILTGKDDWRKEIEGNAVMLQCEDPNLAGYVSSNGDVVVFSVKDGKEVFSARLDEQKRTQHMDKVDSAVLLTDRERFFVMLNRPVENNNFNYMPALTPGIRALRVNGHMYCFDRTTQKRLWYTDDQFENQLIVLDQFQDLPIVIGANNYNRINNGVFEGNGVRVIALDKRTGSRLYDKELGPSQSFHAMTADPRTGTVELIRTDLRIKFTPDDSKSSSSRSPLGAATAPLPSVQPVERPVRLKIKE